MGITIREIDGGKPDVVLQRQPQSAAVEILARARRAYKASGYAGDLTPHDAWTLASMGIAELIDVRTVEELQHTGHVPFARHIEWVKGKDRIRNNRFISELNSIAAKEDLVLFICRSGARSVAASQAATIAGFRHVFNVVEGIEGNGSQHSGWIKRGLPVTAQR